MKLMRKNGGFTLVELIVVIAILAILAGIAVPAYSGYIQKAEKAADLQLLGAVNESFQAACVAEGTTAAAIRTATLDWADNKVVGIESVNGAYNAAIDSSFKMFYAGNEGTEFKVLAKKIGFVNGVFVEGSGNMTIADINRYIDVFNKSNMAGKTEELAGSVGNLSAAFADLLDQGKLNLGTWMGADYEKFLADYNLSDESTSTEIANATIMYTASKMEGVTAQTILDIAGEDMDNVNAVFETYGQIPTAAMLYGVVTGYANSEYASDTFKEAYATPPSGISDVNALVGAMKSDANFNAYMNNTGANGAVADMDGYLAAMQVINGHEGTFDLTQSDAFTNDATMDLLNSFLNAN